MSYREEHPDLNWTEADEVSDDDLRAASAFYEQMMEESRDAGRA